VSATTSVQGEINKKKKTTKKWTIKKTGQHSEKFRKLRAQESSSSQHIGWDAERKKAQKKTGKQCFEGFVCFARPVLSKQKNFFRG